MKTNSIMESSNLGYQVWAIATYLLTTNLKSVSSMKLHRDLKISQPAAWHLAHRIRKSFEENDQPFNGIVEADETYVGGLEKNKHWDKKLNAGRGAVGKKAVAGLKDRDTNQVTAKVIEYAKRKTLHDFIGDSVEEGSTVCTDDFASYQNMQDYDHRIVKHSVGKYVDENIHINGMESFWSVLKRAHKETFHKISHKHLNRYVTEFAGRHNNRPLDTIRQMENIVMGMLGKKLRYKDLVA
ncbi:MAG: IS1595 family transposase [Acidiferrobacterales bacterium]|nr:IS1595 family transposase [Acidiferrobacterales bacterium]